MSVMSAPSSRRDRKRAAIIAAAKDLFFKEGYAGASMAQINARAGGSKATLYSHFRSKEELLIAVVQEMVVPSEVLVERGPPEDDFPAWLDWLGRRTLRRLTSYDFVSIQRLATAEALRFPEVGKIYYEAGARPFYEFVAPFFSEAMDKGVLRRADPLVAAEHFIEMCAGWLLRRVLWNMAPTPTEAQIETNVTLAVTAFMQGYATRRG